MSKVITQQLHDGDEELVLSVQKDEQLTFVLIGVEAGEKNIVISLNGEGAKVTILGIIIGHSGEYNIRTTQRHVVGRTESDLLIKSVLFGEAQFSYRGLIKIDEGAQGANAYQRNDNLLLSNKAKVDTKPELEILADDVRCTHGATTGQLNKQGLFYLMSRGLSQSEAQKLMIEGFINDVLDRIPDVKAREEVSQKIISELDKYV